MRIGRSTLYGTGHSSPSGFIYGYPPPLSLSVRSLSSPGDRPGRTHLLSLAFVVTIAYWALLASSTSFSTPFNGNINSSHSVFGSSHYHRLSIAWENTSLHILNSVFALSEILLTFLGPIPWLYLPVCIFTIGLYIGLAYISHASQNFYRQSPHPFCCFPSSVFTLLLFAKSLQVPRSEPVWWAGCRLCVRCPDWGMRHLLHRLGGFQAQEYHLCQTSYCDTCRLFPPGKRSNRGGLSPIPLLSFLVFDRYRMSSRPNIPIFPSSFGQSETSMHTGYIIAHEH